MMAEWEGDWPANPRVLAAVVLAVGLLATEVLFVLAALPGLAGAAEVPWAAEAGGAAEAEQEEWEPVVLVEYPDGHDFALSLHFDADHGRYAPRRAIFNGLLDLGYRGAIVTWWPVNDTEPSAYQTNPYWQSWNAKADHEDSTLIIENQTYVEYLQGLERRGFYVTLHGASGNSDNVSTTVYAYKRHEELFGHRPLDLQSHDNNEDAYAINEHLAPAFDPRNSTYYLTDQIATRLRPELLASHVLYSYRLAGLEDNFGDIRSLSTYSQGKALISVEDYVLRDDHPRAADLIEHASDYYVAAYYYVPNYPDLEATLLNLSWLEGVVAHRSLVILQTHDAKGFAQVATGENWSVALPGQGDYWSSATGFDNSRTYRLNPEVATSFEYLLSQDLWNVNGAAILKRAARLYEDLELVQSGPNVTLTNRGGTTWNLTLLTNYTLQEADSSTYYLPNPQGEVILEGVGPGVHNFTLLKEPLVRAEAEPGTFLARFDQSQEGTRVYALKGGRVTLTFPASLFPVQQMTLGGGGGQTVNQSLEADQTRVVVDLEPNRAVWVVQRPLVKLDLSPEEAEEALELTPQGVAGNPLCPVRTYRWESDREGYLGEHLTLKSVNLSPGQHNLTVVAVDECGKESVELIVTLEVKGALQPPASESRSATAQLAPATLLTGAVAVALLFKMHRRWGKR